MIRSEYLGFLKTLTGEDVSADVRKIANLVLNYLDTLIPLSTSQGQRIKKIASLSKANWGTISADIQSTPQQATAQTCPFMQLKSISVGPFRGFAKQENFDLAKVMLSLSTVLGTDAKQPPWTYLNKGTHDETDLPEFEQTVVNQIVTALEELDAALKKEAQ